MAVSSHSGGVYSVAPSPFIGNAVVTGGGDETCRLWDLRGQSGPVHVFKGHKGTVIRVEWSPRENGLFVSGGEDGGVAMWSCYQSNQAMRPSEPLFKHEGHSGRVDDLCWNPGRPAEILSVDSEGSVQIWEPDMRVIRLSKE